MLFFTPASAAELVGLRVGVHNDKTRLVLVLTERASYEITHDEAGEVFSIRMPGVSHIAADLSAHVAGGIANIDFTTVGADIAAQIVLNGPSALRDSFVLPPPTETGDYRLVLDFAKQSTAPYTQEKYVAPAAKIAEPMVGADAPSSRGGDCDAWRAAGAPDDRSTSRGRFLKYQCAGPAKVSYRGDHSASVEYPAPGFSISQTYRAGPDTISGRNHVFASTLSAANSWRSEVDARATLFEGAENAAELSFGVFDSRQPLIFTRGGFGVDEFERWRENSVADVGLSFSGLSNRIRVTAGAAYSESALRFRRYNDPVLWIYDPDSLQRSYVRSDNAHYQSIAADLIEKDRLSGSFTFSHVNAGQDFRAYQSNTVQDVIYEGSTTDFLTKWRIGESDIAFKSSTHRDAFYDFNENAGSIEHGAVELSLKRRRERIADSGFLFAHDETLSARARINMATAVSASDGASRLIPDEVTFGFSQRKAVEPTLFSNGAALRRSFGAGASKAGENYSTDIYFHWKERDDFSPGAGPLAASEWGVDLNQSFFFDDLDFSFYVLMSDERRRRSFDPDGRDRSLSAGASFSKSFENLPPLKLSVDLFESDFRSQFDDFDFANNDFSIRAETTLTETVFTGREHGVWRSDRRRLELYLGAYYGASVYSASGLARERESETRVLLMLRTE